MKYTTEQRRCLLSFFAEHPDRQFTIEALRHEVDGISKSAIYRNINQMVKDGIVRRFQKEESRTFLYQFIGNKECNEHFHLRCSECGSIFHMDMPTSNALIDIAGKGTGFELDKTKTLLLGHCASCK